MIKFLFPPKIFGIKEGLSTLGCLFRNFTLNHFFIPQTSQLDDNNQQPSTSHDKPTAALFRQESGTPSLENTDGEIHDTAKQVEEKANNNSSGSETDPYFRVNLKTMDVSMSSVTDKKKQLKLVSDSEDEEDEVTLIEDDHEEVKNTQFRQLSEIYRAFKNEICCTHRHPRIIFWSTSPTLVTENFNMCIFTLQRSALFWCQLVEAWMERNLNFRTPR